MKQYMTYEEASLYLGINRRRVGEAVKFGKLNSTVLVPKGCKQHRLLTMTSVEQYKQAMEQCRVKEFKPTPMIEQDSLLEALNGPESPIYGGAR